MDVPIYGFLTPARLWALLILPILIVAYILIVRKRAQFGMRYTNTTVLGEVLPKQSQWLRHVIVALSVLSILTLGLAWARPVGMDRIPQERATVVMVIDVSWSMTATDVLPNRLEAAQSAAIDFVESLPAGFNVAVVSLSGHSKVHMSPENDHGAAVRIIQALTVQDSSAVGDAIMAALQAIDLAPEGSGDAPAMIVMLSDGSNTIGQAPLQAAKDAADREVPIYTIAFGTDNGYVDLDGERHLVPPDHRLMREIAELTDGQYYQADDVSQLNGAYTRIHSKVGYVEAKKEITATAAGLGLIFAFAAAVGAVMMGVRFR
ncbi:MAG: VWA domain-containing protein [Propionibacteriaceae bacterium]|jgi:Ca-activated chloride channel family protein|nr:VWA domain-containing protein [Propionibacteriaceae bacterium]